MKDQRQLAAQVREICQALLRDDPVTLDALASSWPSDTKRVSLYQQILADCESAVEHAPAHLLTGRTNWKVWRQSGLYDRLRLDALVLDLVADGLPLRDAEEGREYALAHVGRRARGRQAPWEDLIKQWERDRCWRSASPGVPLIVVDREGWISIFGSEEEAAASIESPDVEAGEYLVFDAHGARIEPRIADVHVTDLPWWRRIRQQAPVTFRSCGADPNPDLLTEILAEALRVDAGVTYRLEDLVGLALAAPSRSLRAQRSSARVHSDPS